MCRIACSEFVYNDWFCSVWHFRKPCVIGAASGADVFLGGKCKSGFGDVRFTAVDGTSLLSCWMETPVCDNATFWVKITANLSASATIIYIYYGNSAANSTSNGTATFDFFDDFSTDTNWGPDGVISCGTLNVPPGSYCAEKNRPAGYDDYRFRFRAATAASLNYWLAYPRTDYPYSGYSGANLYVGSYQNEEIFVMYNTQGNVPVYVITDKDEEGHVVQVSKCSSAYAVTLDDTLSDSGTDSTSETGTKVAFHTVSLDAPLQVDWVFLAKYVSSEPASGGWGAEEGTGSAAPSPAAFVIWGTQDYVDVTYMGGDTEKASSEAVCTDIYSSMSSCGRFGYCSNYWGFDTQPDSFYNTVSYCATNSVNSWIFYKGHSNPATCNYEWCFFDGTDTYRHFAIYDSEGCDEANLIKDYLIFEHMSSFTHNFVFLWTCGYGNESLWGDVVYTQGHWHTWGMMASWMGRINLYPNAWNPNNGDNNGQCFISFEPYSAFFKKDTDYNNQTYGDFAAKFYEYLAKGTTVRVALDNAALYEFGKNQFADCYLNQGYLMPDPYYPSVGHMNPNATGYMRVWGDGGISLPST